MDEVTRDSLWGGELTFWQPARRRGYRFNLDPVLLAGFARPAAHVVELGTGCGVLAILLLAMRKAERVTAVEVQPPMADLARRNAEENGFTAAMTVVTSDLRHVSCDAADAVIFNPPYFRADEGRGAPHDGRDAARHERHGGLADFFAAARAHVKPTGYVAAVLPWSRREEAEALWRARGGVVSRRRAVRPRAGEAPKLVLVEGVLGEATLREEEPLAIHEAGSREFTREVKGWLRE